MLNRTALKIAKTSFQEIRLLLYQGNTQQALEMAEALRNLPLHESSESQADNTHNAILGYLQRYPDRRSVSHWGDLLAALDTVNVSKKHKPLKKTAVVPI